MCLCAALAVSLLSGCKHLRVHGPSQYVYVVSKGTFLRDRVAAVSNKVADIHNGDQLTVLQHERRFLQVRTSAGKVGWLEEHAVVDQATYDKFEALKTVHAKDPVVATAILRDELFLHLTAGRKTDHLFLLPENDKLQLLVRASVPKPLPPQGLPQKAAVRARRPPPRPGKPVRKVASGSTIWAAAPTHPDKYTAPDLEPPAQPLEDWWLIRDQSGHVGWVLARRLDVDIPDQVAQYSEGKRIVGAYILNTVYDPGGPIDPDADHPLRKAKKAAEVAKAEARARRAKLRGQESTEAAAAPALPVMPGRQVPQFLTVTQEFQDGLPFDWDQVRVFIWNTKKHRYETAYRLRELQGFMPVVIGRRDFRDGAGKDMGIEPTFTIRTTPDGIVTQDPATGAFHPQTVETTTYRLEGGIVRRADPAPPPVMPTEPAPQGPTAGPSSPASQPPGQARRLRQAGRRAGANPAGRGGHAPGARRPARRATKPHSQRTGNAS